jgi:hypothetical protein
MARMAPLADLGSRDVTLFWSWHANPRRLRSMVWMVLLSAFLTAPAFAQELEIRRWNQLPIDRNYVTANYARTTGEIAFDPVLQIEGAEVELDTWLLGYIRTFQMLDKTARIEVRQAWQEGTWSGTLAGEPTAVSREGLADTFVRLAVNLIGSPPLKGEAFAEYRALTEIDTIVGAALGLQLPTGNYLEDKLINLGSNRITFRPQLGMQHKHYAWIFELTGTASLYTDNTSFFNGNHLEQAPLFSVDGSIEYDFASGLWVSAGAGLALGGQSTLNGIEKDDRRQDIGWSLSAGFPLARGLSFKASYISIDHYADVGTASDTVAVGLLATW